MPPIIARWKLVKNDCFVDNRRTKDTKKKKIRL